MSPLYRLLAACLLLGLLSACAPKQNEPLRVGINAWPGYEFLFLAQEKGFYRAEGVEVRVVEFSSLLDCRRAYERGQIDVMGATVIEVLQVRDHSTRSPQVVQVVDYSDGADVILAREGITNVAGLRGKIIGVELASLGVYILARALEKHGLTLADVSTLSMDPTSMEEAFINGELDAMVTYPPFSIKVQRGGKARTVFSSADIPGEVLDVIAVEANLGVERPNDVAALLRAFQRAVDYTGKNPADAHAIMAAREGITAVEFADALTNGVKSTAPADQAAYFAPGGKLAAVIDHSNQILRQTNQITGPDRRAGISNTAFLPK